MLWGPNTFSITCIATQPKSDARIAFMPIMLCEAQPACKAY